MQDPSHGVPPQLLQHVHLLSSYQYPYIASALQPDQILDFLISAPRIIREAAGVAWTYLSNPRDGTLFLAWQPTARMDTQFASDGYIWTNSEKTLRHDRRGFTFEIFMAESGYDPRIEQVATHRRVRYRLIGSSNGQPVDPALEIVHYTQALPENRLPARQIPVTPHVRKSMAERQWLEAQGQLIRKEFMLNDRNNWPTISMPGGQMQPNYGQQNPMYNRGNMPPMPNARVQGQAIPYPNQATARPPYGMPPVTNRRPNQGPATRMPAAATYPGMRGGLYDAISDDEENPASGDMLDMLTPRDISYARYLQHHEWMEEIFSSPYSASQITPMALGLGLPGELSELTEGLLHDPIAEPLQTSGLNGTATITPADYEAMGQESVVELEQRVAAFLKRGEEQLDAMRKEHAKRMDEMSQGKRFGELEKKITHAPWDSIDDQGRMAEETVKDIVEQVESSMKSKISPRDEVVRIQMGGLILEDEKQNPAGLDSSHLMQENREWNMAQKGSEFDSMAFGQFDGEANALASDAALGSGHAEAQSNSLAVSSDAEMAPVSDQALQESTAQTTQPRSTEEAQMDVMNEDMDLGDVANVDMTEDAKETEAETEAETHDADVVDASDWILVNQDGDDFNGEPDEQRGEASEIGELASTEAAEAVTTEDAPATTEVSTAEATPGMVDAGQSGTTPGTSGATPGMFDETGDFGDFDDLDTAGEALQSYGAEVDEDLGLDLEPSAFGDAFENHETPASGT